MTNDQLARDLIRQADDAMTARRAALTAAVALGTTRTLAAARKAVADPDVRISPEVRTAALQLLTQPERTAP